MWHFMGLDGLEGFEQPFKPQLGSVTIAKQRALLDSCTRVRVNMSGNSVKDSKLEVVSPFGNTIEELQTYPFFPWEWRAHRNAKHKPQLREFGCSIALSLYLRFNWEFAQLMIFSFLCSLPHVIDNSMRNEFRSECRAALVYDCE